MKTTLLVFDVDDTLYLERDYVYSGFEAVGRHLEQQLGFTAFFEEAKQLFEDGNRGDIFDRVIASNPELKDVNPLELVDIYRAHTPRIKTLPDAAAAVDAWRGHAIMAVVTDGPAVSQQAKIKALGVDDWADEIVVTADRGSGWPKPSTRAFQYLQEKFGIASENCVYFGDNPTKDFQGPRELGWRTVRLRRPGGIYHDADVVLEADEVHPDFSTLTAGELNLAPGSVALSQAKRSTKRHE